MVGCVVLLLELILVFIAPVVGVPLLIITLIIFAILYAAKGGGAAARALTEGKPPAEGAPAGPILCAVCRAPITGEALTWPDGRLTHRTCSPSGLDI